MKKVILGIGMLFSGIIGFIGFCICLSINGVAVHSILTDWLILPAIFFIILSLIGLIIGISGVLSEDKG